MSASDSLKDSPVPQKSLSAAAEAAIVHAPVAPDVSVDQGPVSAQEIQELRRRARQAQALCDIAQILHTTPDLPAALHAALALLSTHVGARIGAIYRLRAPLPDLELFVTHSADTTPLPPVPSHLHIPDFPFTRRTIDAGIPCVFDSCEEDGSTRAPLLHQWGMTRVLCIPFLTDSTLWGMAYLGFAEPAPSLDPPTLAFTQAIGLQCALALQKAQLIEASRTEQARMQVILDYAPLDIAIWDRTGRVVRANDRYGMYARFQALKNRPYTERVTADIFHIEDEEGNIIEASDHPLARAIRGEKIPPTFYRFIFADGTISEYIATIAPSADGQSIIGIYQDIGPLRKANAQATVAQAIAEGLAQTNELKNKFIVFVAHELRTPLTGIRGFAELLALRDLPGPLVREYADKIVLSAIRMQTLLDEYLDIHRLEAGAETIHCTEVDVTALVQEAVAAIPPDRQITVEVGEHSRVLADAGKLRRVLDNLLSNALKYSHPSTSITVRVVKESKSVVLEVADHGPGIPIEAQPHIFEKFFRVATADAAHNQPGTGLGLAICREIVEQMGGHIGFVSTGTGTTFWVRLPLMDDRQGTE